jgi:hypothetical protein
MAINHYLVYTEKPLQIMAAFLMSECIPHFQKPTKSYPVLTVFYLKFCVYLTLQDKNGY